MRRRILLGSLALLAACAAPPAPGRELGVGMFEYGFVPARIEVVTGERVRFLIRNSGRLEHDFVPDDRGRALGLGQAHLRPGDTATFDWTAPATETSVRIVCTIQGHEALGMVATLSVRGAP